MSVLISSEELIEKMKNKGITFNYMTDIEASNYLKKNNNYFNLTSYRKNYMKNEDGKYIDLDFSYLKDLAIIDMQLRTIVFKMSLDIEHYLKMEILKLISYNADENRDVCNIVNKFLEDDFNDRKIVHNSLLEGLYNCYSGNIVKKYYSGDKDRQFTNIPIWAFLEIISFGSLLKFYDFYSKLYDINDSKKMKFLLNSVKQIRNAAAHNNCILNEICQNNNEIIPSNKVLSWLEELGIEEEYRNLIKNDRVSQIVYLIYVFNFLVNSEDVKKNRFIEFHDFLNKRIIYHKDFYNKNEKLKKIYIFIERVVYKLTI